MSHARSRTDSSRRSRDAKQPTMRVAIVGTSGLAYYIAYYIHQETGHQLIFLSRTENSYLTDQGYQVLVVDYENRRSLEYALRGIDVVISVIPGEIQLRIIDAAIRSGVRRFAPAEFEGLPNHRPRSDPLDRGKAAVESHLDRHRNRIESTIFVCGVLYERFAPGGLAASNLGRSTRISGEAEYMVDVRNMKAEVPYSNANNQEVSLCMTSAPDVGRFVTRALDIDQWPPRLVMQGDRMTTYELLGAVTRARGKAFEQHKVTYHSPQSLRDELSRAQSLANVGRQRRLRELIATQDARYFYSQTNLNMMFPDIEVTRFEGWLSQAWTGI